MLSLRKTLEANMHMADLFPAGNVFWAVHENDIDPSALPSSAVNATIASSKLRLFQVERVEKLNPEATLAVGQIVANANYMEVLASPASTPNSRAVRELVSKREAEIQALEARILRMDYEADQDMYQLQERPARSLRKLQSREMRRMGEIEKYVVSRTALLLEQQEPMRQRIICLRRANELSKASIAGMNKTPSEVISLIFREYIDSNHSVWDLVGVCKHWRHLAFGTPHLWKFITITSPQLDFERDLEVIFRKGQRHVCYRHSQFMKILDRCGSVALDIVIEWQLFWGKQFDEIVKCLKLLTHPSIMNRVESLTINVEAQELMDILPDYFLSTSFERLQYLTIGKHVSPGWHKNLFHAISRTSNKLHTFKSHYPADSIPLPTHIWLGIKTLQVGSPLKLDTMDEVVRRFSHVEHLTCLSYYWPDGESPCITFPHLLNASFLCLPSSIRLLDLPVVQKLRVSEHIWGPSESPTTILNLMDFPELKSLEVTSLQPDRWLTNISMPKLEVLRLVVPNESIGPATLRGTSLETFSALRTLYITTKAAEPFVIGLLELLPGLTSVTYVPSLWLSGYGRLIVPRLSEFNEGFTCSPNLKELTLGKLKEGYIFTRKWELEPMIKRLVRTRAKHRAPLAKLEVLWRK
ncbi:297_t:CDS:2, partial [Acaulospora colombiana]